MDWLKSSAKLIGGKAVVSVRLITAVAALASIAVLPGGAPRKPTGQGLLLSDIHFDPLALPTDKVKQLYMADVDGWEGILSPTKDDRPATYQSDSNYSLVESALDNAAKQGSSDFVIFTGDVLRHDFGQDFESDGYGKLGYNFPSFAAKTAGYVAWKLTQEFPNAPVIVAIGNNDSVEGEGYSPSHQWVYFMKENDPTFKAIADQLKVFTTNPSAKVTFVKGGYCLLPHPTAPDRDIVVLNSVFWSAKYGGPGPNFTGVIPDVGQDQIDWLREQLKSEAAQNRRATLVMHIPPGADSYASAKAGSFVPLWSQKYLSQFLMALNDYPGVAQAVLAGHSHMDDFRVVPVFGTEGVPLRTTPSVSPYYPNYPAYSTFSYGVSTAEMDNVTTYNTYENSNPLVWAKEYVFTDAYSVPPFSAGGLTSLSKLILQAGKQQDDWKKFYSAQDPANKISDGDIKFYSCAQRFVGEAEYNSCISASTSK